MLTMEMAHSIERTVSTRLLRDRRSKGLKMKRIEREFRELTSRQRGCTHRPEEEKALEKAPEFSTRKK